MDAYLEGIRLFNNSEYWHAHEQWEACWLASQEPDATFYKGLIQAAAALVHWQKGNPRGLLRNWAKSRPKLDSLPHMMHGIDLRALIEEMDRFVDSEERPQQAPLLYYNALHKHV
jgi:hypothetical protein